jgi:integrase
MPVKTALEVRNAKPGRHAVSDGLYLLVKPTGARSWLLRVQFMGKRRDIGLGTVNLLPKSTTDKDSSDRLSILENTCLRLEEAKEKAAALRKLAKAGRDPVAERDKGRQIIPTFAKAMEKAHEDLGKGWVPKHAAAFKSSLEAHIIPKIGQCRVDSVDGAMVRDALAPIWTEKPAMAQKLRVRINQVLDYAKARKWRSEATPAAKEVGRGLAKLSRGGNFAAMPYADVLAFMAVQQAQPATAGRLALLFAILTAARSGEVRAAAWEQIDLDAKTWTRPATIMKMKVAHVVALNDAALAVLKRAKPYSNGKGLVFPGAGGKQLSDMTLTKALRDAGQTCTVHGFRSSFRDWCAEKMPSIPAMVAEMALAHSVGTATERAYLRTDLLDMRRLLMTAWGEHLSDCDHG